MPGCVNRTSTSSHPMTMMLRMRSVAAAAPGPPAANRHLSNCGPREQRGGLTQRDCERRSMPAHADKASGLRFQRFISTSLLHCHDGAPWASADAPAKDPKRSTAGAKNGRLSLAHGRKESVRGCRARDGLGANDTMIDPAGIDPIIQFLYRACRARRYPHRFQR